MCVQFRRLFQIQRLERTKTAFEFLIAEIGIRCGSVVAHRRGTGCCFLGLSGRRRISAVFLCPIDPDRGGFGRFHVRRIHDGNLTVRQKLPGTGRQPFSLNQRKAFKGLLAIQITQVLFCNVNHRHPPFFKNRSSQIALMRSVKASIPCPLRTEIS